MPRDLVRAKNHDRTRSLGWLATAWMEFFVVHGPGDVIGQPVQHGDEMTGFIVDCYALDADLRLLYDAAFLSRPKGADKSGMASRFGLFEGLGPCRAAGLAKGGEIYRDPWGLGFEYVYEPGEPMGRPVSSPFIRCMATEEQQTGNVYDSIYYNLTEGPLAEALPRKDDAGKSRIVLPGNGEITPSTASSAAKDGGKETWADFDETHLYVTPELRRMYQTVTRNLRKRKKIAGTWYLETTTMYAPADGSIAEATYRLAETIKARQDDKSRRVIRDRLLFDHRWGDCEDLSDEKALRAAIVEAYGDAASFNDVDGIVDEFHNILADENDSRRYFLNAPTSATNAYLYQHEWAARGPIADEPETFKVVADNDIVTLGFDGSRGRAKGKPDATALIGCRVADGHLFEVGVWEAPNESQLWPTWEPPIPAIEAAIADCFRRYRVAAFYADPGKDWRSHVNKWEAQFGSQLFGKKKVTARRDHPFEWWMTGGRSGLVQIAVEQLEGAVRNGDMSHDGSFGLTRHMLNARRRLSHGKLALGKENDYSPNKIDAAVAAVLAWQARLDAVAAGVLATKRRGTAKRIY